MLQEQIINGERVILGGNGALVASKSEAGAWHVVKFVGIERVCDCRGFSVRHNCRHVRVVEQLERERTAKRDTTILAGPATVCRGGERGVCIDPPLFTERKPWKRPEPKTFEELFGQSA